MIQASALPSGIEVTSHDGREPDAVITADAQIVFGLAVGMLNLEQVRGIVAIEGDEAVVRDVLTPSTQLPAHLSLISRETRHPG
jgi:hypothetical protein